MTPAEKCSQTWQRKRERREAERQKQAEINAALMRVIEDPTADPADVVRAVELLAERNQHHG